MRRGFSFRALVIAGAAAIGAAGSGSLAQVTPIRECAHSKQPILATVAPPERADAPALGLELINPATGQVVEARPTASGEVNLAEVFPRLWTNEAGLVYLVQAVAGKQRVGAPIVLTPMVAPRYASRVDRDGTPQVAPAPKTRVLAGYWTYVDQRAVVKTSKGELTFALRPDAAPNSVDNFRELVRKRFYDGIKVHRIASLTGRTLPDIMQFGDPSGTGQGGPGYLIDFEPSPLRHGPGTLSLARTSEPNSAGSQVIVTFGREAGAQLDGRYTVFGQLVEGAETLRAISKTPADADGNPREPVVIESVRLVDAPPYAPEPKSPVEPTTKPPAR